MHFLKVREGEPCILMFENGLKYGDLIEQTEGIAAEANTNI